MAVGIYRCRQTDIRSVYTRLKPDGRQQLRCTVDQGENDGITVDLVITASHINLPCNNEDEVLLILGLGRPFEGTMGFSPKRCFILVLGFVKAR